VQIKTNFAASHIGFRGTADLLLVLGIKPDGSWEEIYFGSFDAVRSVARFSARDNKHMVAIKKLKALAAGLKAPAAPGGI
jgi:hypothetical protein